MSTQFHMRIFVCFYSFVFTQKTNVRVILLYWSFSLTESKTLMLTGSCPVLSNFLLQICGTLKLLSPLHKMIASITFCSVLNVSFSVVQWSASKLVPTTSTNSWIFLGSLWYCKLCIKLKYSRSSTFKLRLFGGWNTNSTFKLSSNVAWRNLQSVGSMCGLVLSCCILISFLSRMKCPFDFNCRKNKASQFSPILVPWNRVHRVHDRVPAAYLRLFLFVVSLIVNCQMQSFLLYSI